MHSILKWSVAKYLLGFFTFQLLDLVLRSGFVFLLLIIRPLVLQISSQCTIISSLPPRYLENSPEEDTHDQNGPEQIDAEQ
jgi:hypothetical protein